jgi:6,7-dimethyl-8-ribityllumazine synthase
MLKKIKSSSRPTGGHFAIVASTYNERYVTGMLRAVDKCLRAAKAGTITTVRVPGAYEIPVVVARLARAHYPPLDAII